MARFLAVVRTLYISFARRTEADMLAKFERVVAPRMGEEAARSLAGHCLAVLDDAFVPAALLARIGWIQPHFKALSPAKKAPATSAEAGRW
jgi:hypothetical protein